MPGLDIDHLDVVTDLVEVADHVVLDVRPERVVEQERA